MREPKILLLPTVVFHFSNTANRQSWALNPFLKPHGNFDKIGSKYSDICLNSNLPIIPNNKFLLFRTLNVFFCMHRIHIISSEMKKVTLKNFIRDFIFLMAPQTFSIGRHNLTFSTKHQSRFPLQPFALFQLLCLHSSRTDFSACILIATYCSFKVVRF